MYNFACVSYVNYHAYPVSPKYFSTHKFMISLYPAKCSHLANQMAYWLVYRVLSLKKFWRSTKKSLEVMFVSSINKVSLVYVSWPVVTLDQ
jgi:hypothetical protein